jgi:hypothetical protein
MKNLSITSGRSSLVVRVLTIVPVVLALLAIMAGAASAAETRQPGRCVKETDIISLRDGSTMIRSAWRCECTAREYAAGVCRVASKTTSDKRTAGK